MRIPKKYSPAARYPYKPTHTLKRGVERSIPDMSNWFGALVELKRGYPVEHLHGDIYQVSKGRHRGTLLTLLPDHVKPIKA